MYNDRRPIILDNSVTVFPAAPSQLAISGNVSGSGCSLTVNGPGTVVLSGASSYTSGTTVLSGTLILANATALPGGSSLIVGAGGTFVFGPTASASNATIAGPMVASANSAKAYCPRSSVIEARMQARQCKTRPCLRFGLQGPSCKMYQM